MLLLFWVLLLMLSQSPGEFKLDFTDIFVSKCPCLGSLLSALAKHREQIWVPCSLVLLNIEKRTMTMVTVY
jgi:hypothetical protein